jgi:hypothetical protein
MKMRFPILTLILIAASLAVMSCSQDEPASATAPTAPTVGDKAAGLQIIPPHASPKGKTYGEWSVAWWQWLWSIPAAQNPGLDETGEFVGVGQSGSVWFLAANFGGYNERTATIPPGKMLFVDVSAWFGSPVIGDPEDLDELRAGLAEANELTQNITFEVDGVAVPDIENYRVQSPGPFSFETPEGSVLELFYGVPAGIYEPALADGHFVMLAPLSRGEHTLRISSELPFGFGVSEVIYHLTVGR